MDSGSGGGSATCRAGPDPKSRTGAVRIVGYSASAGFVITIIATGGARAGVTAWKSSGADLRDYEGQG